MSRDILKKETHDELMGELLGFKYYNNMVRRMFKKEFLTCHHYKVDTTIEFPLMSDKYPMGFIDMLLKASFSCKDEAPEMKEETRRDGTKFRMCKYGGDATHERTIIIELKQTDKDIGQTVRQITLYKKLYNHNDVISTVIFSKEPSPASKNILKQAKIWCFTLEELKKE